MKQFKPFLKHILDETEYLLQNSEKLTFKEFINNGTLKRSFVRSLEVIGEATKNLSNDFRKKYPRIEWEKMAGLRDILIHKYFGIIYESVWDVVKNKIPDLKLRIKAIINEIERE